MWDGICPLETVMKRKDDLELKAYSVGLRECCKTQSGRQREKFFSV